MADSSDVFTPEQLAAQAAAALADDAVTKVLTILGEQFPDQQDAHISGALMAMTRRHIQNAPAGVQFPPLTVRDVIQTFMRQINLTAEALLPSASSAGGTKRRLM